jgi:hypothetical protein
MDKSPAWSSNRQQPDHLSASVAALIALGSMAGFAFGRFELRLGRALQMFIVAGKSYEQSGERR